jgi:5'-nucleotidase
MSQGLQTLGNHEVDHGIEGLVPFLERIETPVVSCNIDATLEPEFEKLFTKSLIIDKYEQKVGIVGVTTTTPANWGHAKLLPEIENVRSEIQNLTGQGVDIIILLSHCGLTVDREIARSVAGIDIIVGGHSHSYLFSGSDSQGPDTPVSDYPTVVRQENGKEVLIVQASAYTKYLGNITLYFNENGEIQSYEGAPIFLANNIPQDEEIIEALKPWKVEIDQYQFKLIGSTKFDLNAFCYQKECSMGSLVTDSMVYDVRFF